MSTVSKLKNQWPNAWGYDNWPAPGMGCPYCDKGVIRQCAGQRTCNWCGKSHLSTKAITFAELGVGEECYSTSARPDDPEGMKVYIKLSDDRWSDNVRSPNGGTGRFQPGAAVIRVADNELPAPNPSGLLFGNPATIQSALAKQYRESTGEIPVGQLWQPCSIYGCNNEPVCMNCMTCQEVHCTCS